jgi:autotransporter strand-loop-strand O-heptosyltransferase
MIYDKLIKLEDNIREITNSVIFNFVKGAYVEIKGSQPKEYKVQFRNPKTNLLHFETTIRNGQWAKCSIEYFVEWDVKVWDGDVLFAHHRYNPTNKRVYIAMDSKALGDTLAWLPYIEEFGKYHNCEMVTSTFHNHMFENQYPHIEFVKPGTNVGNLYAMYSLGLFYNEDNTYNALKHPSNFLDQPMQKMATDILGLEYVEVRPKLPKNRVIKDDKLITIAIHGTAQTKYWNNPNGWQEVVDWLNNKGYKVKLLSRENDGYMGNTHPMGILKHPEGPLESVMDEMRKSKAFIGIGSGLSWLSWALDVPTVLISGFSYDWAEMSDCVRITPTNDKCIGCFNRLRLDGGDWNWCPDHKDTPRQFECTKSITGQMVINELEKFL